MPYFHGALLLEQEQHNETKKKKQKREKRRFQATIYWKQLKFLIKKYQNINLVAPFLFLYVAPVPRQSLKKRTRATTETEKKQKAISSIVYQRTIGDATPHIVLSGVSRKQRVCVLLFTALRDKDCLVSFSLFSLLPKITPSPTTHKHTNRESECGRDRPSAPTNDSIVQRCSIVQQNTNGNNIRFCVSL